MFTPSQMKGKTAIVTGASSGLGRATSLALAEVGADLCLADVNEAGLRLTAEEAQRAGVKVVVHAIDLADSLNCRSLVEAAVASFGKLDALCNVAGVDIICHMTEMSVSDYQRTIAVNLNAPFFLMQASLPHLLRTDGAIVNVASAAAYVGEAYNVAYAASKAGLMHMTKSVAMEYSRTAIRVNAVAPGGMKTGMAQGVKLPEGMDASLFERYLPVRGAVEVRDVARLIAYLASPAAEAFHGACISIDKGLAAG